MAMLNNQMVYLFIAQVDFYHESYIKGSSRTLRLGDPARGVISEMWWRDTDPMLEVVGIWWNRAKHRAKSILI